jgi:hypothetical protein
LAHNIIVDKELNLLKLQALSTTSVKTSTYRSEFNKIKGIQVNLKSSAINVHTYPSLMPVWTIYWINAARRELHGEFMRCKPSNKDKVVSISALPSI